MTTLAEFMIIVGADNHPLMLEKSMYDSWKSRMELDMENRENRRMILNSVQNGPLVWPSMGLPPDVYAIVNHHKVSKEIWDRVKLLMQGMKLSLQEKECKLYDDLAVLVFTQGYDLIAYLNKAMAFLPDVAALRKCTQPKRPRKAAWFKDKEMLAEAQESGQILDEEQLEFLADPCIPDGQAAQITILNYAAF
nr:integrase, catalytic region, zinc finger, CCHC-type, peptidase aspartic, catalytic [Tanacetum cinerariifolium]